MAGIVVRTLSEQLVELVRNRIIAGDVAGDGPIRQDALAGELGVSKIPLREALARLEQEGLVRSRPNHGFFVRPMSADEAEEVYALRLRLEPEAVGRAAARADPAQRAAAEAAHAALDSAADDAGARNRAFHLALVRPADRPITTATLERLHYLSERYVRHHLQPSGRDARADDEHRGLLDAWLAGDAARARALTRAHIAQTRADLRRQLHTD